MSDDEPEPFAWLKHVTERLGVEGRRAQAERAACSCGSGTEPHAHCKHQAACCHCSCVTKRRVR